MAAGGFITDLKQKFRQGDIVTRLIFLNVGAFLLVSLVSLFLTLFRWNAYAWLHWLELPAWVSAFVRQPWSLITYMFMHAGLLHLLFNMLWLYWFGRLFLNIFSSKHLRGLYVLGGICGGLLYMIAYNVFPYFEDAVFGSYLLGASASVLAIVIATAVREGTFHDCARPDVLDRRKCRWAHRASGRGFGRLVVCLGIAAWTRCYPLD